jgi:hypothetical protein
MSNIRFGWNSTPQTLSLMMGGWFYDANTSKPVAYWGFNNMVIYSRWIWTSNLCLLAQLFVHCMSPISTRPVVERRLLYYFLFQKHICRKTIINQGRLSVSWLFVPSLLTCDRLIAHETCCSVSENTHTVDLPSLPENHELWWVLNCECVCVCVYIVCVWTCVCVRVCTRVCVHVCSWVSIEVECTECTANYHYVSSTMYKNIENTRCAYQDLWL